MTDKRRGRELGIAFAGVPGPHNSVTDVPGVEVGFCTLIRGEGPAIVGEGPVRTGVTAIFPHGRGAELRPVWAGQFGFNGNGEMTGVHWIRDAGYFFGPVCLTNSHSVGIVHHAVVRWLVQRHPEVFQDAHAWAMPVVAETYDGITNDICGLHVREEHVLAALDSATGGPVREGNVGGGTGMICYDFKGGTGTSSRRVEIHDTGYTLGVLVQANFGKRKDFTVLGVPVGRHMPENVVKTALLGHETGSILAILATDAPLSPRQLERVARRATLGIGRTGTTGGHYSGDLFLAFSTANRRTWYGIAGEQPATFPFEQLNDHYCNDFYAAAVQAVEESIVNALLAAEPMTTVKPAGHTVEAIDARKLMEILRLYGRADG